MSKAATLANIPSYSFMRNRIINGGMDVWQRGTSFSNTTSTTTYTADRWSCYRGAYAGNITISQVTGLTIDTGINRNALRVQRTAGDTNTTNALFATQSLESINSRDLAGQPVTLSFWARRGANFSAASFAVVVASGTGTDEALRGAVTGYTAFISTAVTLTTSFARYTFTGTVPANANQLHVSFGFTPTGTAGAADSFDITDVQLEPGPAATPFERRQFGQELALCQRYAYAWGPGNQYVASYSSGLYSDANQITMLPLGINVSSMRSLSATITAAGTQGTDWLVQTAGGVNQTGFTLGWSAGVIFVTKAGHGITNGNCNLQVVSSNGRIIVATEL